MTDPNIDALNEGRRESSCEQRRLARRLEDRNLTPEERSRIEAQLADQKHKGMQLRKQHEELEQQTDQ